MSEQEAEEVWRKMPESPFRKLIQYQIEIRQLQGKEACSMAKPDEFLKHQGIVQGLGIALGILARKDPIQKSRS